MAAPPGPVPVTAVTLTAESVTLSRDIPGRVAAWQMAEVRPQVTGIIRDLQVVEGGEVRAGDLLYRIDDASYQAEYDSAMAVLERALAAAEIASMTAARISKLASQKLVSEQEHEDAEARLREARAEVGAAEAGLARVGVTLERTRIVAPIDGTVGKSSVRIGALVTANQHEALLTIQQLDPVYVDLTASANEWLALRRQFEAGTLTRATDIPVTILLDDGSRYEHEGQLLFAETSVAPTTGSFLFRVRVANPDHLLMPGMYVRAQVSTGIRDAAILVPQQGIQRDPKGNATAMIVGPDGKAEVRPVMLDRAMGDRWLVGSGLTAGDRVIVEGLQRLRPGVPVEVTATELEKIDMRGVIPGH